VLEVLRAVRVRRAVLLPALDLRSTNFRNEVRSVSSFHQRRSLRNANSLQMLSEFFSTLLAAADFSISTAVTAKFPKVSLVRFSKLLAVIQSSSKQYERVTAQYSRAVIKFSLQYRDVPVRQPERNTSVPSHTMNKTKIKLLHSYYIVPRRHVKRYYQPNDDLSMYCLFFGATISPLGFLAKRHKRWVNHVVYFGIFKFNGLYRNCVFFK